MKHSYSYCIGQYSSALAQDKIKYFGIIPDFVKEEVFIANREEHNKVEGFDTPQYVFWAGVDSTIAHIPNYGLNDQSSLLSNSLFIDSKVRIFQINSLHNDNYIVGKPIPVEVCCDEEGQIIADIREIEIYSVGQSSYDSALLELEEEIIDLFDNIAVLTDDKLGPYPLKWKRYLLEHVARK